MLKPPEVVRVPPPACRASPLPEVADALSAMRAPKPRALPLRLVAALNTELSVDVVRRWTAVLAAAAAMPPATSTWPFARVAPMLLVENWPRAVPMVVAGIGAAVPSCGLHAPTLMAPCRVVVSPDVDACLLHEAPATAAARRRQE